MADEIATMVARLDADMTRFEKNINKTLGIANTRAASIEKRFQMMNRNIGKIDLGGMLSRSFGAIAGGLTLNKFRELSDTFTRIQNNMKVAGLSGDELASTMQQLYTIAQRTGTPLEGLSELYAKATQAQKTLGASSQELVGFTSIVANAIQISGKSASEASGALLQLGQALSSGKVQAEEYNSMLEGLYPLLQAAAAGMKEAGGDVSKLTALVKGGKVSSEAFFRAIEAGSSILTQKLAGATATTSQGFTRLQNDLTLAAGKIDEAFAATAKFNSVLSLTGGYAKSAAEGILTFSKSFDEYAKSRIKAAEADAIALGQSSPGFAKILQAARPDLAPKPTYTTGGTMDGATVNAAGQPLPSRSQLYANRTASRPVVPVSLADFKAPPGTEKKTGAKTENEYQREVKSIEEKIAMLNAEKSAIGGTAVEIEKAKAKQELLNAANEAGKNKNGELNAAIDQLAGQYATLKVAVDEAKAAQDRLKQANEAFISGTADLAGTMGVDFKNALIETKDGFEALKVAGMNAMTTLADMAIKLGIQLAVLSAFGAMGFPVGGIMPTLPFGFGGTRAGGGSMQPGKSFMVGENGPERFVPTTPGQIIPKSNAASIVIHGDTIDARGADAAAIARLERTQAERDARLRRELPSLIREHSRHGRMN